MTLTGVAAVVVLAVPLAPPGASPTRPPVLASPSSTYVVRSGDTLGAIARRYGVTVAQLVAWNRLASADVIEVGQVLVVRSPAGAFAPGTSVSSAVAQQVLVADRTSGSVGTFVRYEFRAGAWVRVGSSPATFGRNGVRAGSQRVSGDGTTPSGTYPIPSTFGVANPGTRMPYRRVTDCSWWSEKPAAYNRFVEQCGHDSGEHLADYTTNATKQYAQTAVIGFNMGPRPIQSGKGSGTAIFLHYSTGRTAGCVGITSRAEMTSTVRWLDPAKHPLVVILP